MNAPESLRRRLDLVRWVDLPSFVDGRGRLTAAEGGQDLPFDIHRVYTVHGHAGVPRGGHAHMDTQQVAVAVHGRIRLRLSDGQRSQSFLLDHPARGLYLGPMLFIELTEVSEGGVLMVMASTHYDKHRSLRSWEAYCQAVGVTP